MGWGFLFLGIGIGIGIGFGVEESKFFIVGRWWVNL